MKALPLFAVLAGGSLLAGSASAGLVAKQLAGPPSEFAAMRPQDPATAAILSKSALLPVQFSQDKSGQAIWAGHLPVAAGRARVLLFAAEGERWELGLRSPNGGPLRPASSLAKSSARTPFGLAEARLPATQYDFDGLAAGAWQIELKAGAGSRGGFLLIEGESDSQLSSYQTHRDQRVGVRQQIASQLVFTGDDGLTKLAADAGEITQARLRVTDPDGRISEWPMFDDGRHGDGAAGDGVVGGDFPTERGGQWLAQVIVEGFDAAGRPLMRSAEHVIPVLADRLQLGDRMAKADAAGDGRLSLRIPLVGSKASGHYRAYGEVWGRDERGREHPVAWVGGMVELREGMIGLGFDPRWQDGSKATRDFQLRNLRIEDPDHFVSLVQVDRLPLDLPTRSRKAAIGEIDDLMRMGPRPANLAASQDKGVGSRLLLVHGYCSSDVWPASQFSNASKFLDLNQNRSHDQFARLLQSFGSSWNSFGVVAHSQGGAASLHLYTYYWSGLDNAVGSRLIQSVGTPYQGTNLAGILASLGSWFGVGCGSNDNLSYSGASAWLAGIPTWARAKVNFYTTGFRTTNWWTNDYCNVATDLVLSDPEDGTTEKVYGQLSGAVNRGHTSGQCHTSGMRDPAQYQDATRNATMNTNAAR